MTQKQVNRGIFRMLVMGLVAGLNGILISSAMDAYAGIALAFGSNIATLSIFFTLFVIYKMFRSMMRWMMNEFERDEAEKKTK